MAKKKTAAKKAPAKKITTKKKRKSPAKSSVNKSEEIRTYVKANKKATASEVQAALAKQGVKVSVPLIYNVKTRIGSKKAAKKKVTAPVTKTTAVDDIKEASNLMIQAVELVVSAGTKEASQLVAAASKIVEKARGDE